MTISPQELGLSSFGQFPSREGKRGPNWTLEYTLEKFWAQVSKAESGCGCWVWCGWRDKRGYGQIGNSNRLSIFLGASSVHRISWLLKNGPIPLKLGVLHRCDNPSCVNPDHLFLGTPTDNNSDMDSKGRRVKPPRLVGQKHPNHKLTNRQVQRIRELYELGWKTSNLAAKYHVSDSTCRNIRRGVSWRQECN